MLKRLLLVLFACFFMVGAVACGDDGGDDGTPIDAPVTPDAATPDAPTPDAPAGDAN